LIGSIEIFIRMALPWPEIVAEIASPGNEFQRMALPWPEIVAAGNKFRVSAGAQLV
jgi:hypothetical protein